MQADKFYRIKKIFRQLFSPKGRIGRTEYFIYIILTSLVILCSVVLFLFGWFKTAIAIFIVSVCIRIAQAARRCHDIGVTGFYLLIPVYPILLLFMAGTNGVNKYGPPPGTDILEELAVIISMDRREGVEVETLRGARKILRGIILPHYAKPGDLIKHFKDDKYIIVDRDGNLVFRI